MRESGWKVKIGRKHAVGSAEAGLTYEADQFCYERCRSGTYPSSASTQPVRVHHRGLGLVVGERVVEPGLDDALTGQLCRRTRGLANTHPRLPQSEVAKNALDDLPVINECDNPHLVRTRAQKQIGYFSFLEAGRL